MNRRALHGTTLVHVLTRWSFDDCDALCRMPCACPLFSALLALRIQQLFSCLGNLALLCRSARLLVGKSWLSLLRCSPIFLSSPFNLSHAPRPLSTLHTPWPSDTLLVTYSSLANLEELLFIRVTLYNCPCCC